MLVGQRSRHRIYPFHLHRPRTVPEAVKLYEDSSGAAAYMSGGIDVMAAMKTGARFDDIIHLGLLPHHDDIHERGDEIVINAGVTHEQFARNRALHAAYPQLVEGWARVANNRIRAKGTVIGNVMARKVGYDFSLAAIAAGAELDYVESRLGVSSIPAARAGELSPGDLITGIRFPRAKCLALVVQLDWKPVVAFALCFRRDAEGVAARLVVGTGFPATALSSLRLDRCVFDGASPGTAADLADALCASLPSPSNDWQASADYRKRLLKVLVRRAIEDIRLAGPQHAH